VSVDFVFGRGRWFIAGSQNGLETEGNQFELLYGLRNLQELS
jgi:hypothetical protein